MTMTICESVCLHMSLWVCHGPKSGGVVSLGGAGGGAWGRACHRCWYVDVEGRGGVEEEGCPSLNVTLAVGGNLDKHSVSLSCTAGSSYWSLALVAGGVASLREAGGTAQGKESNSSDQL